MEWVTTSTILERLRGFEDQTLWERFCARFRKPLVRFAQRLGLSDEESDDAAQEVLLVFAAALRDGRYDRSKGRLNQWLFGIAYRQITGLRRKRRREKQKQQDAGGRDSFWGNVPDERAAYEAWDAEWERAALDLCLRQVRVEVADNTYRAFELVMRQGRTPDEAAAELKMSREAVYVAKHRVLKRLNELMGELNDG